MGSVQSSDEATLKQLKSGLHNPDIVAQLGSAGWVAPHYDVEHGGRGLSRDDARSALTLLAAWEVPHVPRFGAPARRPNDSTVVKR